MKIKTWLRISYLAVMLLPLLFLFLLYSSISEWDKQRDITEYMEVQQKMQELSPKLDSNDLYKIQPASRYEEIKQLSSDKLKISLYRPDGISLFSSLEDLSMNRLQQRRPEDLYKGLNEMEKNMRSYVVKKPVLADGNLIGIYEVTFARQTWMEGVENRTLLYGASLAAFLLAVYAAAALVINRKLNRPLQRLENQMERFAGGMPIEKEQTAGDEIGALYEGFYQMKTQLEKSQKEIVEQQKEKEFILAALSHDMKTPLTVIRAYAEALTGSRPLSAEESSEYKEILLEKLGYMKQLIDDLALYASLQTGQKKIELAEVEGEEFFEYLLSGFEEPCLKKGIRLQVETKVSGMYMLNASQMIRIADNLMANAIRHTGEGSSILSAAVSENESLPDAVYLPFREELEEWRKDGAILLVQNEGSYIPEQLQKTIFLPFVQGEDSRAHGGSSGIGLSISKMLLEQHEGKISVWSSEGDGTLFACWIRERKETNNEI
ncbi:HAMP domain-containing sensor histidine kinase [Bacillus infantis]|uniref:HAMP domain-containing sensor histidine kinase n=1 Tax=Bacillus infantis TaxID=324767 RepID=UPI003CF4D7C4